MNGKTDRASEIMKQMEFIEQLTLKLNRTIYLNEARYYAEKVQLWDEIASTNNSTFKSIGDKTREIPVPYIALYGLCKREKEMEKGEQHGRG